MSIKNKDHVYKVATDMDGQHENVEQIVAISHSLMTTSNELQSIFKQDESISSMQVDKGIIEQIKAKMDVLLAKSPLFEMQQEEHKKWLNEFFQSHSDLEAIWSNRMDGTFVYSNPPAGLVNAKARPWFSEAAKGHTFLSDVYTSALTKKPCITLSFPISYNARVVGVIGVDVSLGTK